MMIGTDTTQRATETTQRVTETTQRATGQISTMAAQVGRRIRDIVNGPLRVINAVLSITILRWILIAFGAVVIAVWWISTRFGRH
jgi:hypothetical protein